MKGLIAGLAVLLVIGVGVFLYSSPTAPSAEMTEAERVAIVAEVEAYLAEYEEAWEALDLDRALSLNVQTPEFTWAMDGVITRSFATIDEFSRSFYSTIEAVDWTNADKHISVLSRDAVAVFDVGTEVVTTTEGVSTESTYTYTYVLVRRDGAWKMLMGNGSFVEG